MHDEPTIGMRLRPLRHRRGMSLAQLADQAGLSKGHLSLAERGLRPIDRRSHIAAIARALRVSETDLTGGPHLSADPIQSAPHSYISALRVALESSGIHRDPVVERARPIDELAALMSGTIERQRRRCDYVEIGKELPSLIDELNLHVAAPTDEAAYQLALEILVEAYVCASAMARNLGHHDLCHVAAMHADEVAVALDDPIAKGKAAFSLIRPNAHNWDRIKGMAERAANTLEPHIRGSDGIDVLGMLTLNAALAAAFCRDSASADQWLQDAAELATRVPDDVDANWMGFSDTNVNIWRVTVGVENGARRRNQ